MEIRGAAGIMTDICRTQVYVAIAIQSGGFNGSLNFWFHVQETVSILTMTDVTNNYHEWKQDTA